MGTFFSGKWFDLTIKVMVVLAALYHLSNVYFHFQSSIEYLNTHLFFALTIANLIMLRALPKYRPFVLLLLACSVLGTLYVQFNSQALEMRGGYPTDPDMVIGVLLVIVTVIGSWWAFGASIPIMIVIFLGYALFGYLIPGYFQAAPPSLPRLISHLSIGLKGVYGTTLAASGYYIFLFIVFGGLLQATKAADMFTELGKLVSKGTRGGPAHSCVVSSALIGMITGASSANAAIGGSITIPIMKKAGYAPEQAAAFESAASQGGQIMPPVMGAAAFVMAEMTGRTYGEVTLIAYIPALFFFLSVAIAVELRGRQLKRVQSTVQMDRTKLLYGLPLFLLPVVILIVLLLTGYSANYAAFWAIVGLLSMAYLRKETRVPLRKLLEGLERGVIPGVQIALACASLGAVVSIMSLTGLSVKLPKFVEMACMNNIWLALVLTMFVSLLLGAGLPTLPTYLICALVTAPVLVNMGVPLLAAHLAVFYFAIFEGVTPPFGSTGFVAAGIAGADFIKTCIEAMKVCFPGLILPFLWVKNPVLLNFTDNLPLTLITFAGVIALLITINVVFIGFYFLKVTRRERLLMAVSFFALAYPLALGNYYLLPVGAIPFALVTLWQFRESRRLQKSAMQSIA